MYVNNFQKFFTYAGYYLKGFSREVVRDIERLTHPMPIENGYWEEVVERVKRVSFAIFSIPFATLLLIPSLVCYSLAAVSGQGRFELIEAQSSPSFWEERSIKVL